MADAAPIGDEAGRVEPIMPAFSDILAIAAVAFAVLTWIVPLVRMALAKRPRSSLQGVGLALGFLMLAASLSAAGLLFVLLTLLFSQRAACGWVSLGMIVAFWVGLMLYVRHGADRRRRG
jgi:hypothetical protein